MWRAAYLFAMVAAGVFALMAAMAQAGTRTTTVILESVVDDYGTPWGPSLAVTGRLVTRGERCAEERYVRTRTKHDEQAFGQARTDRGREFLLELGLGYTSGVDRRTIRAPESVVRRNGKRLVCEAGRAALKITAYPTATTLAFNDDTNTFSGVISSENPLCIQEGAVRFGPRVSPWSQSIIGFASADDQGRWAFSVSDEPEPGHYVGATNRQWSTPRLLGPASQSSGGSLEQKACSDEPSDEAHLQMP